MLSTPCYITGVWNGLSSSLRFGWPVSRFEAVPLLCRPLTGACKATSQAVFHHQPGIRDGRGPVSQCAGFTQKRLFADQNTSALMLLKDLKHLTSSPVPALALGLGGLIPFIFPPMYMIISGTFIPGLAFCHVAYGASILSFIGGVRWGTAVSGNEVVQPNWFNMGYSVTPSLIAWTTLMFPTGLALITLMTGLAGTAYMDITMLGYPPWFKALRFILSMFAILSLWTSLMCMLMMPKKADKDKAKQHKHKVVVENSGAKQSEAHDLHSSVEERASVIKTEDHATNIVSHTEGKGNVEKNGLKE